MTREQIIKLAREAGIGNSRFNATEFQCLESNLERFAALVSAAERTKCAMVCREIEAPPSCNDIERILWGVAVCKCSREVEDRSDA